MESYKRELARLRPHDGINSCRPFGQVYGTYFIDTYGHGYLAVPVGHQFYETAANLIKYGYKGDKAVYLEEDCEMGAFLKAISA